MKTDLQECLERYREQLNDGYLQAAYTALIKYVAELKANIPERYHTGNISVGYLDYTYFPFFDQDLRDRKLRFGVVPKQELRFELWLMGQNRDVQKKYWDILRNSEWNCGRIQMPRYSVLEVVLEDKVDFVCKESMTKNIIGRSMELAAEIRQYIEDAGY